jgi:Bardet-Biedl syndrome 4 protein
MEDQSNAFATFGKALSYDPSYVPSLLAIASILQSNNDWDVALAKYRLLPAGILFQFKFIPFCNSPRIVATEFDHSCALWNNIGMCFFGKGKLVAALVCLHKANYLCPLDWKVAAKQSAN